MNDIVQGLGKITDHHIVVVLLFLALMAPGIGVFCVFFPDLLKDYDVFKIILLSGGYSLIMTLPVLTVILIKYAALSNNKGEDKLVASLTISSGISVLISGILLLLAYYSAMSFNGYLILSVIVMALVIPILLGFGPSLLHRIKNRT